MNRENPGVSCDCVLLRKEKTSREFRMSAEFSFFVFSTMYGDTETKKRGGKNGWRAHTGPVLKKSNPESEDETWEKEKVFSNGF